MDSCEKALIHLYAGDGKGKTTAAVGLAARALGSGRSVLFCQFLKSGQTGELASLETLGAHILRAKKSEKFTFQMDADELAECAAQHRLCLERVRLALGQNDIHLLVLDEVVDAVNCGMLPLEELLELLETRPACTEAVLTGRNPPAALEALADYHTRFLCEKHPFQKGIPAREGIEY